MNHFPARALSLILAVLLLLSAAGISFAAVLSGTRVYAEEGSSSAQTSAEPESAPPPKTSAPDIIFVSSSTSGGRLTAQADKADHSTPDNERSSSASNGSSSAADSSSSETSSDNSPDAVSYTHLDVYKRQGLHLIQNMRIVISTLPVLAKTTITSIWSF